MDVDSQEFMELVERVKETRRTSTDVRNSNRSRENFYEIANELAAIKRI